MGHVRSYKALQFITHTHRNIFSKGWGSSLPVGMTCSHRTCACKVACVHWKSECLNFFWFQIWICVSSLSTEKRAGFSANFILFTSRIRPGTLSSIDCQTSGIQRISSIWHVTNPHKLAVKISVMLLIFTNTGTEALFVYIPCWLDSCLPLSMGFISSNFSHVNDLSSTWLGFA